MLKNVFKVPIEMPFPQCYVDIETTKVPCPPGWFRRTKDCWLKKRWKPFMVTIAYCSEGSLIFETFASESEYELIESLKEKLEGKEVRYGATRKFDEMVLCGRFTNARRAFSPIPGDWPNLSKASITWVNVCGVLMPEREREMEGIDCPIFWKSKNPEKLDILWKHCIRDVIELVVADAYATPYLRKLLTDFDEMKNVLNIESYFFGSLI